MPALVDSEPQVISSDDDNQAASDENAKMVDEGDSDPEIIDSQEFRSAYFARNKSLQDALHTPFAGNITIADRTTSIRKADAEYSVIDLTNKLVFWTDASKKNNRVGIGIAWKPEHHSRRWHEKSYALEGINSSHEGEFFAIAQALKIAIQYIKQHNGEDAVSEVLIYSDASMVLEAIRDYHITQSFSRNLELARLKERARMVVNLGVRLSLEWVKGHRGVDGNVRADRLAAFAVRTTDVETLVYSSTGFLAVRKRKKLKVLGSQPSMRRRPRASAIVKDDGRLPKWRRFEVLQNPFL